MSDLAEEREVILGVDTHLDVHVAVLVDVVGRLVATTSVPTTALGYEQMIEWARGFGRLTRAGLKVLEPTARRLRDECKSMAYRCSRSTG